MISSSSRLFLRNKYVYRAVLFGVPYIHSSVKEQIFIDTRSTPSLCWCQEFRDDSEFPALEGFVSYGGVRHTNENSV